MKKIVYVARAEFQRGTYALPFAAQIVLTLVWLFMNVLDIVTNEQMLAVCCWRQLLDRATTDTFNFAELILILGTVSFAWSFREDRASGFLRPVLQRVRVRDYCLAKFLAVALLSFLASTVAILVFVLLSQFLPLAPFVPAEYLQGSYLSFAVENGSLVYLIARCLVTGLTCSLAAVIALAASSWVDNLFVVLLAPFILYQFIDITQEMLESKVMVSSFLFGQPLNDPGAALLATSAVMLAGMLLAGIYFYLGVATGREML